MIKLKHFYKKQTVSADNIPDGALLCTVTMAGGKTTIEKRVSTND